MIPGYYFYNEMNERVSLLMFYIKCLWVFFLIKYFEESPLCETAMFEPRKKKKRKGQLRQFMKQIKFTSDGYEK